MSNETSLPGVNVCLMGPTGTGKTHSIGTLVDTGIEVVYFAFEAGVESLLGYWTDKGKPVPTNLRICTVKAASASWTEMADNAKKVNQLSYEALKKTADSNRSRYDQFEKFIRNFNDVTTDDGEKLGNVGTWGTNRAIVVDGLSGLGHAAMAAVVGGKYDKDPKDYGLAMSMIEETIRQLCDDCRCHFVLLTHIERETDLIVGGTKITVSTLGNKLAPKLPQKFSDAILTVRLGREWYWDTENSQADLKTRNLPIAAKNAPDFGTIISKWRSRGGVI